MLVTTPAVTLPIDPVAMPFRRPRRSVPGHVARASDAIALP